ncbi:MAG: hypothetical protein HUJ22_05625 [Gracilimonas sp.]|uniref:translocation/assembly module TamB domain-containing protein n=1 Tax=Gracilimonas sp. TaxID=1974203 RepID=UPI001999A2DF|nr:hypothetical protein [Gracilimonas sp.]MBD3616034.1 hypothetical protein [Gracilimonas sp.]
MSYLRWLHKSWNIFWTFIGVLVLSLAIVFGGIFGALQIQPVKDRIAVELQQRFNEKYEGVVSIGSINGFLPFYLDLNEVKIYPDSASFVPVLETTDITAGIDVWSLFQNRLVVNSLQVNDPKATFDAASDFSIHHAFKTKEDAALQEAGDLSMSGFDFQIIIPSVIIQNGNVVFRNIFKQPNDFSSADSLQLTDLQMDMFFEFTEEQRFMDINTVSFNAPGVDLNDVQIYGQIYNDDQFFELNAVNISTGNSSVRFSGEADGVNILEGNIAAQFENSNLSFIMDRLTVEPEYLDRFFPNMPALTENLQGSLNAEGSADSLYISDAEFILGESYTNLNGYLKHLTSASLIEYEANIESLIVSEGELRAVQSMLKSSQMEAVASNRYEGKVYGTSETTNVEFLAEGERGGIELAGNLNWGEQTAYDFTFATDSLDLGYLFNPRFQKTNLSLRGEIKSSSFDFREAKGGLIIESDAGDLDNRKFNRLYILANWDEGFIEPEFRADIQGASVTSTGWIDIRETIPEYSLEGKAEKIQLNEIIQHPNMRQIQADIVYDLQASGQSLDEVYGRLSLDVLQAVAGNDTLGRHQMYLDLNAPGSQNRVFRFTSTAFDATVEGDFDPAALLSLSSQWSGYFRKQIQEEILFEPDTTASVSVQNIRNQSLALTGRVKNPGVVNFYFEGMPSMVSSARINSSVNVNSQQLLFNTTFNDSKTNIGSFNADSLNLQATGSFRYGELFKNFSGLQVQANAAEVDLDFIQGQRFNFSANLEQDSLRVSSIIAQLGDDASFVLEGQGIFMDEALTFRLLNFSLGTDIYNWASRGTPVITYQSDEKLVVENFLFKNEAQMLEVNGTFSTSPEDSVNYNINSVDLHEISSMLAGRLNFGGTLDGRFTTRTLTTIPTVQGRLDIEAFNIDELLVGDVTLNSIYNSEYDRFDTHISVSTDSAKYPEYFANSDRQGQEFEIDGYVLAPQDGDFPSEERLYEFDIDFKNIDLWILPLIGPKVFADGSGLANGTGKIWGNDETYDFEANFMVGSQDAAYLRPQFLDTYYYAQGELSFTRDNGLTFKDIYLIDPSGGNAILSGFYDFNDFEPTNNMNIRLEMDEFQFLNSSFDPTLAFFGKAYGSSTVVISGTNFNPVLRTETPIRISDFSEISIPLMEETEFNEDNRFIRFVESFDTFDITNKNYTSRGRNRGNGLDSGEEVDLSFAERFTLDLQFVANNPMTVRLIFDPVTGDIVTAEGTGRLRILLEDEQVSMFGRFDIEGGRYQFVSGDIFTRRFELEPGGSIIWEGDPANARLDLNAIYSARPDINTLSASRASDPDNAQRVPVELVYNIGGTIYSLENDFFFRLPNTFESQQSSTLSTQLASINRDENMKLIQAANFMLMGDFIPVSSTGDTQGNLFGDNISGSAAVLSPLLSSQVINPLLSNQVNSLLNSDLSSLDVDFNLNTYNQVDLGVALRLYNDKLILRREGQITGRQSNIGDLGATYRINRTFALTAFHRQDLTFGTLSSTEQSQQSQDINGVGLEAKVGFNTWEEFFSRLFSPFRKLFGIKKKEQNQEDLTENRREEDPE